MHQDFSLIFSLGCCALGNLFLSNPVIAQDITTDGSTSTTVSSDGSGNFTIEQGDRAGNNLFHSFGNFSVPTDGSAFFNNAIDISNILSRVTGGNISNIDGLIRANGSANLFLINPAGILFGNNAQLAIGGSFLGTTADSILFDEVEFSATDLDNPPLLTINAPIGLNFRDNPGDIVNRAGFTDLGNGENIQEAGLEVNRGQAITLVGGDINLENGRLTAPGGRIELGGLAEEGTIKFNEDLSLNFSNELSRSNVTLTGFAEIDVTSGGGGDIAIYGQNISVLGGSDICAGIGADGACGGRNDNFGSVDAQAGDIRLDGLDTITIADPVSAVNNQINTDAFGNAGDIEIITGSLSITDGGFINTSTFGLGNGGKITINASDSVSLGNEGGNGRLSSNNGRLSSNIEPGATGNSGGVEITTGSLSVNNFSQIQSQVEGQGNSGKIIINAQDTVSFDGRDSTDTIPSAAFSRVVEGGVGNSGGIEIKANSLSITNRAQLSSTLSGAGGSGDIIINTNEEVSLSNSIIISEVSDLGGEGNGGNISITTGSLLLQDASALLSDTENIGNAGNINIEASEQVILEGEGPGAQSGSLEDGFIISSQISSTVDANANPDVVGDGGNININTSALTVQDNGFISASTFGLGDAGNIVVTTEDLTVSNSVISTSTFGLGNSGNLTINALNSVKLNGERPNTRDGVGSPGGLLAQVDLDGEGQAGEIKINTNLLSVSNGSKVQVATFGNGDAGDLTIRANQIEVFNDPIFSNFTTGIFASVAIDPLTENPPQGSAGNIDIETQTLKINDGGKVTSSTEGIGNAGNIRIKAEDSIEISGVDPEPEDGSSLLGAEVESGAIGNGGNINVETNQLTIQDQGQVLVSSEGSGNAGNLMIKANNIKLENQGQIIAETGFGEGGNITLNIDENLTLGSNSLISAQAFGDANGGNLSIDTDFIIAFPDGNNDIIANAEQGQGGMITINAESLLGIEERPLNNLTNDINASSEDSDLDGDVTINSSDINPVQGAAQLPSNIVEPEQSVAQACANGRDAAVASSFVIKGKGGIPPLITAPLSSEMITINGEIVANSTEGYAIPTSIGDITPARGVIKTPDGRIILTATPVSGSASRMAQGSPNCG